MFTTFIVQRDQTEVRVNLSCLFSTCSNKSLLADMHTERKLLFFFCACKGYVTLQTKLNRSVCERTTWGVSSSTYPIPSHLSTLFMQEKIRATMCVDERIKRDVN